MASSLLLILLVCSILASSDCRLVITPSKSADQTSHGLIDLAAASELAGILGVIQETNDIKPANILGHSANFLDRKHGDSAGCNTHQYDRRREEEEEEEEAAYEGLDEDEDEEEEDYEEGPQEEEEEPEEREDRGRRRKREEGQPEEEEKPEHHEREQTSFVLEKTMKVIKTDAGELRIHPHHWNKALAKNHVGLGFLSLEPKALLLPHYIDGSSLFLVHAGKGRLSWVDKGESREADLRIGDVFKIEGGTVYYIFNRDESQRLQIFSIYDTEDVYDDEMFHNYFVAGSKVVFSGFSEDVLATAFQASPEEVTDLLMSQTQGSIMFLTNSSGSGPEPQSAPQSVPRLQSLVNRHKNLEIFHDDTDEKPYNILSRKPGFINEYGSTVAVDGNDYNALKDVNKGVFSVQLKAGALLAPHWNPRATEIGIVTKGEGEIQIVYPNGTLAAQEHVKEGMVFYVPRNFPMCQISSTSGPFEFMGFTTSARPNNPQFLAGPNSVLQSLDADVLALSFNVPPEHLRHFLDAQTNAVVLPGQSIVPRLERRE